MFYKTNSAKEGATLSLAKEKWEAKQIFVANNCWLQIVITYLNTIDVHIKKLAHYLTYEFRTT